MARDTDSKMARLTTRIATAAGTSSTYAQCRAVSLNMAKTLTVVALLGYVKKGQCCVPHTTCASPRALTFCCARLRAAVRFVSYSVLGRCLESHSSARRVLALLYQVVCLSRIISGAMQERTIVSYSCSKDVRMRRKPLKPGYQKSNRFQAQDN